MANYPVGLGNSRISIVVTDDGGPEAVVMTIYTVHIYRESRPSLPMFGDHVMCSFVQVTASLLAASPADVTVMCQTSRKWFDGETC